MKRDTEDGKTQYLVDIVPCIINEKSTDDGKTGGYFVGITLLTLRIYEDSSKPNFKVMGCVI